MKTRKTNEEAAAPPSKSKLKIKILKLRKETIENLSDLDATKVKGGNRTNHCPFTKHCGPSW